MNRFAEAEMSVAVAITRLDLSARELRMSAAATWDGCVARRLLALVLVPEGAKRRGCVAWTVRPCAIGCIAIMMKAWMGFAIGRCLAVRRG